MHAVEIYTQIMKHLYRDKDTATILSLLRVSRQLYDLASPYLYRYLTLDNTFFISFLNLHPVSGTLKLQDRHKEPGFAKEDYPTLRLVQSELRLTRPKITLNDRQKICLGFVQTVEIPERIDSKICQKLKVYLKTNTTPFVNVRKAIFGPVILFEAGLYMTIPHPKRPETKDHPSMIMLSRLVQPDSICAHVDYPSIDCVEGLVYPYLYTLASGMTWSEICDPDIPLKRDERLIEEDIRSNLGDDWRLRLFGPASMRGIERLRLFKTTKKLVIHGIHTEFDDHFKKPSPEQELIAIFPKSVKEIYPSWKSVEWEDREDFSVVRDELGDCEKIIRHLLGKEESGNNTRLVTMVGLEQIIVEPSTERIDMWQYEKVFDLQAWRDETNSKVGWIKRFAAGVAKNLGYKVGNVRFKDDLGVEECTCCGLESKDAVHELVKRAKFKVW